MKNEKMRWLAALAAVILLAAVTYSLSDVVFQTNDDNTILAVVCGGVTGTPEAADGFTTYGYGWLLSRLYSLCPSLPWHALLLTAAQWAALTALLRSLLGKNPWLGLAGFGALYAGVAMKFMVYLQFTATAGFCAAGASALLLTLPDGRRGRRFCMAFAMGLMLFALLVRRESGLLALPAPLLCGLYRAGRGDRRTLAACGALLVLAAGIWLGDNALYRQNVPDWQEQQTFDEASAQVLDYRNTKQTYQLARQVTDWTKPLCDCFRNWNLLFDRRFDTERLSQVVQAAEEAETPPGVVQIAHKTLSLLKNYQEFGWNALAFALLSGWLAWSFLRRRDWLGVLLVCGLWLFVLAVTAYFYGLRSRLPDRVALVYALPVYAALLTLAMGQAKKGAALLLLVCAAAVTVAVQPQDVLVRQNARRQRLAEATRQVNAYAAAHAQNLYVTDVSQNGYAFENLVPPVNLVEWCSPLIRSHAYRQKFALLGYPEGLDTLNLADEGVYLLMESGASVNRLAAVLAADGLDWTLETVEQTAYFTVWRLQK